MKSIQLSSIKSLFCVAVLATALLTGCSDDDDKKPAKLSLSKAKVEVKEAATTEKISIVGGTSPYTVETSSKETATVKAEKNDFTVTGVKKGTATVTVKDKDGESVKLDVTVTEKEAEKK